MTYESKYKKVKNQIVQNVKGHECDLDIDCEEFLDWLILGRRDMFMLAVVLFHQCQ